MLPTLQPGEQVLVDRGATPDVGQLAVVRHPTEGLLMVKRVSTVNKAGSVEVSSDNPTVGIDSRHFGPIPSHDVDGVVSFSLSHMSYIQGSAS